MVPGRVGSAHGRELGLRPLAATLRAALRHAQPEVMLQATRTLELLGSEAKRCATDLQTVLDTARSGEQFRNIWMFIRFSAKATLHCLR
jgi:hypothetical protein